MHTPFSYSNRSSQFTCVRSLSIIYSVCMWAGTPYPLLFPLPPPCTHTLGMCDCNDFVFGFYEFLKNYFVLCRFLLCFSFCFSFLSFFDFFSLLFCCVLQCGSNYSNAKKRMQKRIELEESLDWDWDWIDRWDRCEIQLIKQRASSVQEIIMQAGQDRAVYTARNQAATCCINLIFIMPNLSPYISIYMYIV